MERILGIVDACYIKTSRLSETVLIRQEEEKMTISELGSLGEVVGAFGLIVTIVFLAMEMKLKREDEKYRDLEQSIIRGQEINLLAAQSPELVKVLTKWNKLTGGILQPLPESVTEDTVKELFEEDERTALTYFLWGNALNLELMMQKSERGSIPEKSLRIYDSNFRESVRYLTVLGNMPIPRRLKERYLDDNG